MFWNKKRKVTKNANMEFLGEAVEAFPWYATLAVELHERLEAIDPDYRIAGIGIVGDGSERTLRFWYAPSKHATEQDRAMMKAARSHTEEEAKRINRG